MGVLRHPRRRKHHHRLPPTLITTFTFLLFSSTSAIATLAPQPCGGTGTVRHQTQRELEKEDYGSTPWERGLAEKKRLSGPGSSPPSCRSKCGWCSPCQPVHVPVQPGLIIRLEYYPEAWRCKCGNKLFMP